MSRSLSQPSYIWPLLLVLATFSVAPAADSDDLIIIDPNALPGSYYRIVLDSNGDYVLGTGDGYGDGWYYYPETGWWRQWYYNDPYDPGRKAELYYTAFITALDYSHTVSVEIRFAWATPQWSLLGLKRPPLPDDAPTATEEALYMSSYEFHSLHRVFVGSPDEHGSVEPNKGYRVEDYNPEWVAIDIRGQNVDVHRGVFRECVAKEGACCHRPSRDCFVALEEDCYSPYEWLGSGSSCSECTQSVSRFDFGDAPDTYGTVLASSGARHTIAAGIYLGRGVDSETDGKPTPAADGDDSSTDDDEDGIVFTTPLSPGESAGVEVTASTQGYLNAWIDFNQNGAFDGKDEQVFVDERLSSGVNSLSFAIPAQAATGETYARFRFNTRGVLPYYGPAQDGEVEDYRVSIAGYYMPQPYSGNGGLKWSQPPESTDAAAPFLLNGWDELSALHLHQIVADDWQCQDDRPITGFRWWGSFEGWTTAGLPSEQPLAFHVAIWTDSPDRDPADTGTFSHPDMLIWETYCPYWAWNVAGYDDDPRSLTKDETCFQFTCLLSQDQWFYQNPGENPDGKAGATVYWLSIAALYDTEAPTPQHPWGWTSRPHASNGAAVRIAQTSSTGDHGSSWPPSLNSQWLDGEPVRDAQKTAWDLAFELVTNQGAQAVDMDLAPVYRFWSDKLQAHFYTVSESEKDKLIAQSAAWSYEGIAFYAYPPDDPPVGSIPVYRFWSESLDRHFYTTDEGEKNKLSQDESKAWTFEGIAWYAFD